MLRKQRALKDYNLLREERSELFVDMGNSSDRLALCQGTL